MVIGSPTHDNDLRPSVHDAHAIMTRVRTTTVPDYHPQLSTFDFSGRGGSGTERTASFGTTGKTRREDDELGYILMSPTVRDVFTQNQ